MLAHPFRPLLRLAALAVLLAIPAAPGPALARPLGPLASQAPLDSLWWTGFGGRFSGSYVNHLCVYGGQLYMSGSPFSVDGKPLTSLARWNGTSWDSVGSSFAATINAMVVYQGSLYVAGTFTLPNGAHNIARWDGAAWHDVGGGLWANSAFGGVNALCVHGNELFANGDIIQIGSTLLPAPNALVAWNGSSWRATGAYSPNPGGALASWNGSLYVAGFYGGGSFLRRLDGAALTSLPLSPDGSVYTLGTYAGQLVAGGTFGHAGGQTVNNLAIYDGATWRPLGPGTTGAVYAFATFGSRLYAGGAFLVSGANPGSFGIDAWDGASWSALGSGLDYNAYDLAVYGGSLHVGGGFTHAGGHLSQCMARWDGLAVVDAPPLRAEGVALAAPSPNPAPADVAIRFRLPGRERVAVSVLDVAGREVARLADGERGAGWQSVTWRPDGACPAGVYFARVTTTQATLTAKLVRVRG